MSNSPKTSSSRLKAADVVRNIFENIDAKKRERIPSEKSMKLFPKKSFESRQPYVCNSSKKEKDLKFR